MIFAFILAAASSLAIAQKIAANGYAVGAKIPLFVDTIVPYHNPSESYKYYSLKFCAPSTYKYKRQTLGEVLQGSEKMYSLFDIHFRHDVPKTSLCTQQLVVQDVDAFRRAVMEQYYFTWYYDDIPIRGPIGEYDATTDKVYLFVHFDFRLQFNSDHVIEVALFVSKDHRFELPDPNTLAKGDGKAATVSIPFTYAAAWSETDVIFHDRSANHPRALFEEEVEIQWYSILNMFLLVILLVGFVFFVVIRILRKDYEKLSVLDDDDDIDETGWKMIHADVFRFPSNRVVFCSVIGVGAQLLLLCLLLLTASLGGFFDTHERGTLYAAIIVLYCLTSVVSGWVSGYWNIKMDAGDWVHTTAMTAILYPVPVFLVWLCLNSLSWHYSSTVALPFDTIISLFALYFLATFPLILAGAILAKNTTSPLRAPCHTRHAVRPIPPAPWYRGTATHVFVAGFLPFCAIYVELYYLFISIWGHQLYTPYTILYLVFLILLVVTSCIGIALTYLQLSRENHEWWWLSLVAGGSTALFVYGYCFYFLQTESEMYGLIQLSYYFGYMALICYALFLMLGAVRIRRVHRTLSLRIASHPFTPGRLCFLFCLCNDHLLPDSVRLNRRLCIGFPVLSKLYSHNFPPS